VADPGGEIIARAASHREESIVCSIDLADVEKQRRNWPFLRDRRIDAYGDLTRRMAD
jgi:N-carbamoylputrescine amidase